MVEPSRVTTVDSEILRHCAFSFPAVAFTLGRANWSCLRQLYNVLARDMQVAAATCAGFLKIVLLQLLLSETFRDL